MTDGVGIVWLNQEAGKHNWVPFWHTFLCLLVEEIRFTAKEVCIKGSYTALSLAVGQSGGLAGAGAGVPSFVPEYIGTAARENEPGQWEAKRADSSGWAPDVPRRAIVLQAPETMVLALRARNGEPHLAGQDQLVTQCPAELTVS
jgi:hypothetical protein